MSIKRTTQITFFIWLLLGIASLLGLLFTFLYLKNIPTGAEISDNLKFLSWACLIIASISIYELFNNITNSFKKSKSLDENIKDFYTYQNLQEPPDVQMYN